MKLWNLCYVSLFISNFILLTDLPKSMFWAKHTDYWYIMLQNNRTLIIGFPFLVWLLKAQWSILGEVIESAHTACKMEIWIQQAAS